MRYNFISICIFDVFKTEDQMQYDIFHYIYETEHILSVIFKSSTICHVLSYYHLIVY